MGWFDQFLTPTGQETPPVPGVPMSPPPPPYATPLPSVAEFGQQPYSSQGQTAGLPPTPAGWDPTKWANPNHKTPKYVIGRILAKYPPTVAGLKQAIPELQAAFPGLTFNGKDKIVVPGLGPMGIDVLQGASGGGVAWQWIDTDAEAASQGNPGRAPVAPAGGVGGGLSGGGGASGGGSGAGGWTMPGGSSYQFGGVPGFNTGYQSSAFGIGQSPMSQTGLGPPAASASTGPTWSPMQTTAQGGAFGSQPVSPGTAASGETPVSTGEFGSGVIPSGLPIPQQRGMMTTNVNDGQGSGGSAGTGGYDHAPSFTPLDPFQSPDVPSAAPEWKGAAFDVGGPSEKFVLPTGQAALDQDPGYQFRFEQGLDALQNSAAARGLLRTGGTLKDIQDFGQRAASQEYQNAVDRALAVAGFNTNNRFRDLDVGLRANDQNNRYSLAGAGFNADQAQQNYQNKYTAANQQYAYANQQNLAGNVQALSGYQTDVGRDLGMRGLQITAEQNAFMNSLNAQQQQWMQLYMMNGQSFDQAYKMMMAQLQYPA